MKRVVISVFGKVQMEGFRYSTLQKARELNINGCVQNLRDGSVEIEAQGEQSEIEEFIDWCRVGPPYADIGKIITEEIELKDNKKKFEILQK